MEKAIFVDEAWKLLVSNELAGEYLLEIFKVIRAYGGSAICATQDLVDSQHGDQRSREYTGGT